MKFSTRNSSAKKFEMYKLPSCTHRGDDHAVARPDNPSGCYSCHEPDTCASETLTLQYVDIEPKYNRKKSYIDTLLSLNSVLYQSVHILSGVRKAGLSR